MKIMFNVVLFILVSLIALEASLLARADGTAPAVAAADDQIVSQFLQSDRPALTSYRARRQLEAVTMGGRMWARLEALTYVDTDGRLQFDVVREEGSGLIRQRVLRRALQTEQDNYNRGEVGRVELNRDNYDFRVGAATGNYVTIEMQPRRISPMLLRGTVMVARHDGDVLRIDGSPSERPSWWTRRVQIVRRYARIDGVRVPVEMSSSADVRVVGESTFLMTYEYTMINGRQVSADAHTGITAHGASQ